ncbi:MAG: hypothetical protein NTU41_14275 [Chloroflexi bacterium]|nr:hypothetical protein [Chloroflexota bacterium]
MRWEYLVFIFTASVGTIQMVAGLARLNGLLFLRWRPLTYLFSILAIAGAYWWFFARDRRIDTVMRRVGLEGSQQFYYFCLGAFLAVVFTLVVSSLVGLLRHQPQGQNDSKGLDSLKELTFLEAVRRSFRQRRDRQLRHIKE